MHLRSIQLKDWRAYAGACRFDFPAPSEGRNVVLIGAQNGFGKTSLFHAIILGLFGRDGMPLIATASFGGTTVDRLTISYANFMTGVLNRRALAEGRTSCSVELVFDDDDGAPLILHRTWHFTSGGAFKPYDEDVRAMQGTTRKPVGSVRLSGIERVDFFRDYVARTFLPYYLGWFFLFDGEMVGSFAEREMAAQVKVGVEGLLGLPILHDLARDLREFARVRGRPPGTSGERVDALEQEVITLEKDLGDAEEREAKLGADISSMDAEQARLSRDLMSYGAGTQADFQELVQRLHQHRNDLDGARLRLQEMLVGDLALALTGRDLRIATAVRLRQEERREQWEAGKAQGDSRLDTFVGALNETVGEIEPRLADDQRLAIMERVKKVWDKLWNPPDDDTAPEFRHAHLTGLERVRTRERLNALETITGGRVASAIEEAEAHETQIAKLQDELNRTQTAGPEFEEKRLRLNEIASVVTAKSIDLGAVRNQIAGLTSHLDNKRKDLARLRAELGNAAPGLRRAAKAEQVATVLDAISVEAVPTQIGAVAETMSAAYRQIAHKGQRVDRIEVDEDCNVRLLSKTGRDLREVLPSAGEKQIFTQALISAVVQVSGRVFPMIVDTPLGRLDETHRKNVLEHLAKSAGQVVLLSTDSEVVGDYLEAIRSRILKSYVIHHEEDAEMGRSWPVEGYFPGQRI